MHSIRVKITAVTIAAILTSMLALGGIGLWTIRQESDRASVEKINLICDKLQQKLNSYFGSIQQSVDMCIHMADDALKDVDPLLFLTSHTSERSEALDGILSAHCAEIEHAFGSIAHNTNGVVTYYYCVNSEVSASEHGFFWSRLGNDDFVRQPPLISTDLDINDSAHTTWYYSPIKAGAPVWVGPYKAHYLGEVETISYVAPIYCCGFLIGVLGMDILFETITEQVDAAKVYDTGYLFLMTQDGTIVYHPTLESGTSPLDNGASFDGNLFKRTASGDEPIRYTQDGREKILAFTTLISRLKLGVVAPVSEINASQRRMTVYLLLASAAILAFFTVVTPILMNALTRPLLNLVSASQRLMDGDYGAELDYDGNDEVGILTQTFRHMRDYLKLYINDLNSRVYYDAMTGVRNKGAFTAALDQLNAELRDGNGAVAFAIVSFDCNNLKHINDGYGHDQGDIYLKTACRLICKVFAHSPVFRLGGDEFGAILRNQDYENRDALLDSFDRESAATLLAANQPWEVVSVARGMAVFDPERDRDAAQVMSRADRLMYKDKKRYH